MRLIELNGQAPFITTRTSTFLLLNLADFILTAIAIELGLGYEGNPALFSLSLWGIGTVKLLIILSVLQYFRDKIGIMRLLNIGVGIVVLWNLLGVLGLLGL